MSTPDPPPASTPLVRHLFVYGTLRPGDVRWPMLEPFVVDDGWPDCVAGQLYDTGLDYPAAIFHASDGLGGASPNGTRSRVIGQTFTLLEASIDDALALLDHEEDTVEGLYRRVRVRTSKGVHAWAYEYGTVLQLTPIRSGDWFQRDGDDG